MTAIGAPVKHSKGIGCLEKENWQKNIDLLFDLGLLKTSRRS